MNTAEMHTALHTEHYDTTAFFRIKANQGQHIKTNLNMGNAYVDALCVGIGVTFSSPIKEKGRL